MKAVSTTLLALTMGWMTVGVSHAGPYADDLSKCLVEKTTREDRNALVRWVFVAASRHPAVASVSDVSDEALAGANEDTAKLFMHLLTESCLDQTRNAIQYEGASTLETSFSVLGQVAAKELFSSPEVGTAIAGLEAFMDEDKLRAIVAED